MTLSTPTTLPVTLQAAASLHRDRVALWARGETRTYGELAAEAAALASSLLQAGLQPGDRVAILSRRSVTLYAAILATLRAGCVYVPLNARFPSARNRSLMERSGARALVIDDRCVKTSSDLLADLPSAVTIVATPESDRAMMPAGSARRLTRADLDTAAGARADWPVPALDDDAYVMFTSGSTGEPKGVPISHRSVAAYLGSAAALSPVGPDDRLIQLVDVTFDLSVHDMFLAWTRGAALYSVPENAVPLAPRLVSDFGITGWMSVPSAATQAKQQGLLSPGAMPSLRYTYFCGEALSGAVAEAWAVAAPDSAILNVYGPTEATVAFSVHQYQPGQATPPAVVPIGRAFPGQNMALLTDIGGAVPAGEIGELHLAGSQLTRGYWQAPKLDAEKFVTVDGERWYRTGDLGRWTDQNGFEYLGRTDHQVKIRGYRVETGEIEAALRTASGYDLVAAVPWHGADGAALGVVGFIAGAGAFDEAELRSTLARTLPAYMVPDRIAPLAALPLNANGKVDYKLLRSNPIVAEVAASRPSEPAPR